MFIVSLAVSHTYNSGSLVYHFLHLCSISRLVSHVPVCVSCVSFLVSLWYLLAYLTRTCLCLLCIISCVFIVFLSVSHMYLRVYHYLCHYCLSERISHVHVCVSFASFLVSLLYFWVYLTCTCLCLMYRRLFPMVVIVYHPFVENVFSCTTEGISYVSTRSFHCVPSI